MSSDEDARDDELVFSALAASLSERPPPRALHERLLRHLRGDLRYAPYEDEVVEAFGVEAAALREAFARLDSSEEWLPGTWPGSRVLVTEGLSKAGTVIAHLPAGTVIASHNHAVRELTYVLEGELCEQGASALTAGELLVAEPGSIHALHVGDAGPCIVVFSNRGP
ncbi:MAG: cupin domain-containing protein [Myxococcales bacterium]|nr:cupin domain-containing protein [Myxococcales bacterium]